MIKTKEGIQAFTSCFMITYIVLCIPLIWNIPWALIQYWGMTQYMIPICLFIVFFAYKAYQVMNISCEMFRGAMTMKQYNTYECLNTIVTDDKNEDIIFTEGWTYKPVDQYLGGYVMINDHGEIQRLSYHFFKLYFKRT